jgi:hypothetical protein
MNVSDLYENIRVCLDATFEHSKVDMTTTPVAAGKFTKPFDFFGKASASNSADVPYPSIKFHASLERTKKQVQATLAVELCTKRDGVIQAGISEFADIYGTQDQVFEGILRKLTKNKHMLWRINDKPILDRLEKEDLARPDFWTTKYVPVTSLLQTQKKVEQVQDILQLVL